MSSTLTSAEISQMRTDLEDIALPDTGDILSGTLTSDGQGGGTMTWGTLTAGVKCRMDYLTGMESVFGGALKPFSGYNLTVPYSATITTEHRFYLNGDTFAVVEIDSDKSWKLFQRAKVERV